MSRLGHQNVHKVWGGGLAHQGCSGPFCVVVACFACVINKSILMSLLHQRLEVSLSDAAGVQGQEVNTLMSQILNSQSLWCQKSVKQVIYGAF